MGRKKNIAEKKTKIKMNGTTAVKKEDYPYHYFIEDSVITSMRKSLLQWYDENKRELPWRKLSQLEDANKRSYAIWVSEIMLQQTQVATVIDYYNKWMQKWPTLQDLAKAKLEEVNEMWSGLGYYSRGRRLHEGAQKVVNELNGEMPSTADQLLQLLPGVGRYTSAAIASIAFNEVTGVVDGNVIRVLARMRAIGADSTSQCVMETFWDLSNTIVDTKRPGDFNQSMMELGATVCSPKNPKCNECPVNNICHAFAKVENNRWQSTQRLLKKDVKSEALEEDAETEIPDIECAVSSGCKLCIPNDESWDSNLGVMNFPRKSRKKPAREEKTAVCIVKKSSKNEDEFLLIKRPEKGLLANMWEFPSVLLGALDISEKKRQVAMDTYLKENVTMFNIRTVQKRRNVGQTYMIETLTVDSMKIECCHDDQPTCRWVTREDFDGCAISTAMKKVMREYESSIGLHRKGSIKRKADGPVTNERDKKRQVGLKAFFKPKTT